MVEPSVRTANATAKGKNATAGAAQRPGRAAQSRPEPGRLRKNRRTSAAAGWRRADHFPCDFSIFAQVSRKVTVRLNTGASGRQSRLSGQK